MISLNKLHMRWEVTLMKIVHQSEKDTANMYEKAFGQMTLKTCGAEENQHPTVKVSGGGIRLVKWFSWTRTRKLVRVDRAMDIDMVHSIYRKCQSWVWSHAWVNSVPVNIVG